MQALQQQPTLHTQHNKICCIEHKDDLVIAQRPGQGEDPVLITAQLRQRSSPALFGARSRKAAIARLGNFVGLDALCVLPLGACEIQHVPVHEVEEDQLDDHVQTAMSSGMEQRGDQIVSSSLRLGCGSSSGVMGIAADREHIKDSLRTTIEAGFNPRFLDIEELACIRGLHQIMTLQGAPSDFVLCRYTLEHMVLALVGEGCQVRLLRKVPIDRSQDALSAFSIAASIAHQIDMMMIAAGQQSKLPANGPGVYIAIDPCLGVDAMKAVQRNRMMAGVSIDERCTEHPWSTHLMREHGLSAYQAITMLGMLSAPDHSGDGAGQAEPIE